MLFPINVERTTSRPITIYSSFLTLCSHLVRNEFCTLSFLVVDAGKPFSMTATSLALAFKCVPLRFTSEMNAFNDFQPVITQYYCYYRLDTSSRLSTCRTMHYISRPEYVKVRWISIGRWKEIAQTSTSVLYLRPTFLHALAVHSVNSHVPEPQPWA